jgi:hypothetical protein
MNAATLHYCPLCRTPHPSYGAVRAHLIVDHKRKMIEADVLLVKYIDLTKPIPERRIDAAQIRDRRAARIRPYSASELQALLQALEALGVGSADLHPNSRPPNSRR